MDSRKKNSFYESTFFKNIQKNMNKEEISIPDQKNSISIKPDSHPDINQSNQ